MFSKLFTTALLVTTSALSAWAQAPANDNCANATTLTAEAACINGTTTGATIDTVIGAAAKMVWYSFTPTTTGFVTINLTTTSMVDFDFFILQSCTSMANGVSGVSVNDTAETRTFEAMAGTTYYIAVGGWSTVDRDYTTGGNFCIKAMVPPASAGCTNATTITVNNPCTNGTTVGAAQDLLLTSALAQASNVAWYSFTPTVSGQVVIDVTASSVVDFDIFILPNGCNNTIGLASSVAINTTNEILTYTVTAGTTYHVAVGGWSDADTAYTQGGTFCVKVNTVVIPANDNCANAIPLTANAACTNGTTLGATADPILNDANGVWYSFTANTTGQATINLTSVSATDFDLFVFPNGCNDTTGTKTSLVVNTTDEMMTLAVTAGTTYYIAAAGWDGNASNYTATGNFCIAVSNTVAGVSDINAASMNVYPNPATSFISVDAAKVINKVEILDVTGRLVSTTTANFTNIATTTLAKGIYVVKSTLIDGTVGTNNLVIE